MYLTELSVIKVLTKLREHISHFSIDYMAEEVVALSTGNQPTTSFVERFAQMGAPWRFGINDLEGLLEEAVMKVVDDVTTAHLYRTYWPRQPLDANIYEHYSLCTLAPTAS